MGDLPRFPFSRLWADLSPLSDSEDLTFTATSPIPSFSYACDWGFPPGSGQQQREGEEEGACDLLSLFFFLHAFSFHADKAISCTPKDVLRLPSSHVRSLRDKAFTCMWHPLWKSWLRESGFPNLSCFLLMWYSTTLTIYDSQATSTSVWLNFCWIRCMTVITFLHLVNFSKCLSCMSLTKMSHETDLQCTKSKEGVWKKKCCAAKIRSITRHRVTDPFFFV